MGKLLGSRQTATDSAGFTHAMSAGHCLTPRPFHPHCGGRPAGECCGGSSNGQLRLFASDHGRPTVILAVQSVHMSLIDAPSIFFPLFLSLGRDGHVMQFVCIQRSYCREEGVIGPVIRAVEKSQVQRAGWASHHGFSFKNVFIMGYRELAADGLINTRSGVDQPESRRRRRCGC